MWMRALLIPGLLATTVVVTIWRKQPEDCKFNRGDLVQNGMRNPDGLFSSWRSTVGTCAVVPVTLRWTSRT